MISAGDFRNPIKRAGKKMEKKAAILIKKNKGLVI